MAPRVNLPPGRSPRARSICFRIINSSAQASYLIHFDNHVMQVISADYTPIVPYTTSTLYINPGQRYNVIVTMNQVNFSATLTSFHRMLTVPTDSRSILPPRHHPKPAAARRISTTAWAPSPTACSPTKAHAARRCPILQSPRSAPLYRPIAKTEPLASLVPYVPKDGGSSAEFTDSALLLPGGSALQQNFAGYGPITRWMFGPPTDLANESATIVGTNAITVDYDNPTLKNIATLPSVSFQ